MLKKFSSPFWVFSLVLIGIIFFIPPLDTDLGWHIRYGQNVIQNGTFLTTNKLSYYLYNYYWPNSYTIYQVFVYLIYKYTGFLGLSFAYSLLLMITYWIFSLINPKLEKTNILVFLLIIFTSWNVFHIGMRAQIFSFSFLLFLFFLLKKSDREQKYLLILPLLFFLWSNFHGAFILGLGALFLYLFYKVIVNKFKLNNKTGSIYFFSGLFSFLATLINPYGINIYKDSLKHTYYPLYGLIADWVRPSMVQRLFVVFLTITLVFLLFKLKSYKKYYLF